MSTHVKSFSLTHTQESEKCEDYNIKRDKVLFSIQTCRNAVTNSSVCLYLVMTSCARPSCFRLPRCLLRYLSNKHQDACVARGEHGLVMVILCLTAHFVSRRPATNWRTMVELFTSRSLWCRQVGHNTEERQCLNMMVEMTMFINMKWRSGVVG